MTEKRKTTVAIMIAIFTFTILPLIFCNCGSNSSGNFEQFAIYERDESGSFPYRIFVFITNATPNQMEQHAKNQTWSSFETTMVCYFDSSEGLNSDAITCAKDIDAALDEVWKPTLIARYMHWPTGKEDFVENPYRE